MRNFVIYALCQCYYEDKMGSACAMLERDRKWIQSFGLETKGIETDGRVIIKWLIEKYGRVWTGLVWFRIETSARAL
jgi:hypothetical protein